MTGKELFSLIKETFPEDFDKCCLMYANLGFGFNEDDAYRASFTTPTADRLDYILVDGNTKIIRVDRNRGNTMSVKSIARSNVLVDIIDKLTMKPVVRIKNPMGIFLENGSIGVDISSKSTIEAENEYVEMPTRLHINPIQNHVLIYRAKSKMSQADIQAVRFPTKIDYENQTFFAPVEIFNALGSIPEVVDFLDREIWHMANRKFYPIGGLGSEGCIVRNTLTKQRLIVAVHIGPLAPEATIIFPDGKAITRRLYDLKPNIRPVNILKEGESRITFIRSDKIKYDSENGKIHLNNLSVDLDFETIVAI